MPASGQFGGCGGGCGGRGGLGYGYGKNTYRGAQRNGHSHHPKNLPFGSVAFVVAFAPARSETIAAPSILVATASRGVAAAPALAVGVGVVGVGAAAEGEAATTTTSAHATTAPAMDRAKCDDGARRGIARDGTARDDGTDEEEPRAFRVRASEVNLGI